MTKCPYCGYQEVAKAKLTKSKALTRIEAATLAALSDDDRRAYYKKYSPADDAYFFAAALNRQGYTDRAVRVQAIGAQYEAGSLTRAATFAALQIERFGWGRDRTADGLTPAARLERAS